MWGLLIGRIMRLSAFHGIEMLVRAQPAALGIGRSFGDDTLGYFTQRLAAATTRKALLDSLRLAKRNKVFEDTVLIGIALDGSTTSMCAKEKCSLCHPLLNEDREVPGYVHKFSMAGIVGAGITLPFDVEPYAPTGGESPCAPTNSELAASHRMLQRVVEGLGPRFADYAIGDSLYANAPFLHLAGDLGLNVVVRLKANLRELHAAVQTRFDGMKPTCVFEDGKDRVEIWDADDFDPWEKLRWETVRVMRYRQVKPDGTIIIAEWLTDFPIDQVGSRAFYRIAKSRWEIENQGFNDAKNRYGMEHIAHHHEKSLLANWLLTCLAIVIERLYRLRHLHRGVHPRYSAIELCRLLWLNLAPSRSTVAIVNTS